jgi:hypothetical protein
LYPERSGWDIFLRADDVSVASTVEVSNADGATEKLPFYVIWVDGEPISIVLDGIEYK